MIANIKSFSSRLGIDKAIAYTVLARIIQAGGGVISIVFIAKYLTTVEQGYYFTFGSILAIQIFFELGLSNIITQFVAHEVANLQWTNRTTIVGPERSRSRLSSLLRFCIKWFSVIAVVLIFVLLAAGFVFFNTYGDGNEDVNWQAPWIILSISTACSLMVSPVLAFIEGLGKVKEVAKIRLFQQISQLLTLFIFLIAGFKLFASPLASVITLTIAPLWILFTYKKELLLFIWKQRSGWKVRYRLEIFPYQWRIALSWISGYFIFQLFNPVLFAIEGPVVAGQMGMTLAALAGILSISLSWINTKVPLFSTLIANKDYQSLDSVFNKTVKQASLICGICLIILIMVVFGLRYFQLSIADRFLRPFPLILLCVATFVNQFVSALATYLRCHKKEPFLIQSITLGILTATSTLVLGNLFGLNGVTIGYCSIILFVSLTWSLFIFKEKKKLWHQ